MQGEQDHEIDGRLAGRDEQRAGEQPRAVCQTRKGEIAAHCHQVRTGADCPHTIKRELNNASPRPRTRRTRRDSLRSEPLCHELTQRTIERIDFIGVEVVARSSSASRSSSGRHGRSRASAWRSIPAACARAPASRSGTRPATRGPAPGGCRAPRGRRPARLFQRDCGVAPQLVVAGDRRAACSSGERG
jgi:hypothetical protein